ncbi:MAG: response regulator, partial [Verrucomicrobiota bacterium]
IVKVGEQEFLKQPGRAIRIIRLEDYLPVSAPASEEGGCHVIIPTWRAPAYGILCPRIFDIQSLPVDPNHDSLKAPGIFATTMNELRFTILIDVYRLIEDVSGDPVVGEGLPDHRILVLEPHPWYRTVLTRYLESAGARVDDVEQGDLALKKVDAEPYDALVIAPEVRLSDGARFIDRIRSQAETRNLPVVGVTRELSGLPETGARAFHAVVPLVFKERLIETLRETRAVAPALEGA